MALSMQEVYCRTCGGKFKTNFHNEGGFGILRVCCCEACYDELMWMRQLSDEGKPYREKPKPPVARLDNNAAETAGNSRRPQTLQQQPGRTR